MHVKHAATAGAEHVPAEIEQAELRGLQEAGDHLFLVKTVLFGKIQRIDAVELVILAVLDQSYDGIGHRRIGGLLQQ